MSYLFCRPSSAAAQGTYRLSGALINEQASERWHHLVMAAVHDPWKQWQIVARTAPDAFRDVVEAVLYTAFPEV